MPNHGRVSEQIRAEVAARPEQIDRIAYGRVTFIIQDGLIVRVETQDGWIPRRQGHGHSRQPAAERSQPL